MTLLSALDDFVLRTLAAVPGRLAQLAYVASLRDTGGYEHWGLSRKHGAITAQAALRDAHSGAFIEVLRAPLASLLAEAAEAAEAENMSLHSYLAHVQRAELTPSVVGGGSKRHLSSALASLLLLSEAIPKHRAA